MTPSSHIHDVFTAMGTGQIPGEFSPDRTLYTFPTLKTVSGRGFVAYWTVRVHLLDPDKNVVPVSEGMMRQPVPALSGYTAELRTEVKQENGHIRQNLSPTHIKTGKNLGKKNATNVLTQAVRDAYSLYNTQIKRGGVAMTPHENDLRAVNSRPAPMLVKKIGATRSATLTDGVFKEGVTLQRKYNGVRLVSMISVETGLLEIYSRNLTTYPGMENIREELTMLIKTAPPVPSDLLSGDEPGLYIDLHLDGEGYLHQTDFSWICGQARRGQDKNMLKYYVYDCFWPTAKKAGFDMPSGNRQKYLDLLFRGRGVKTENIIRVENFPVKDMDEIGRLYRRFLEEDYEGAIARKNTAGYDYGFHSANLVKIKQTHDDEFEVVGFTQGEGKDTGAVIWICEVGAREALSSCDRRFRVVPNGQYVLRTRIYKYIKETVKDENGKEMTRFERDIKGLLLTVQYADRSKTTGKPLQPRAIAFRTYEDGADPIQKILAEC